VASAEGGDDSVYGTGISYIQAYKEKKPFYFIKKTKTFIYKKIFLRFSQENKSIYFLFGIFTRGK